jgi:hypothetical protein
VEPRGGVDRLALLEASRRLDWRFLLPDPELGRVAHVGQTEPALLDALRALATSVTVVGGGPSRDQEPGSFPVVVAAAPTREELDRAIALLGPGGWLYVERRRSLLPTGRGGQARAARIHRRALVRRGLDQMTTYWHWPDFAVSKWIVPVGDPTAVRYALRRHGGRGRARVLRGLGLVLLRTGLLGRVVPHVSVVARLPPTAAGAAE